MFDTNIAVVGGIAMVITILLITAVIYFILQKFIPRFFALAIASGLVGLVFVFFDITVFYYFFFALAVVFLVIGFVHKTKKK